MNSLHSIFVSMGFHIIHVIVVNNNQFYWRTFCCYRHGTVYIINAYIYIYVSNCTDDVCVESNEIVYPYLIMRLVHILFFFFTLFENSELDQFHFCCCLETVIHMFDSI